MKHYLSLLMMALCLATTQVACDKEVDEPDSDESVGEDIEDAADETADDIDDAVDEAEDEVDEEF